LDQTSNVTRVEIGPQTFIRKDNEKVILAPTKMVIVPPGNYCCVTNPAKKDKNGEPVKDTLNQVCNICIFYTMAIPVMEFQLQTLVSFI
jgi:major vault protein